MQVNAFERFIRLLAERDGVDYEAMVKVPFTAVDHDEGDYLGEDGLVVCGVCGLRKEMWVQGSGDRVKFPIVHKHQIDDMVADAVAEARRTEREKNRIECFSDMPAGINYRVDGMALDTPRQVAASMNKYATEFEDRRWKGRGLLINGRVGVGKTFLACAVANLLVDRGYRCKVASVSRLMAQMGPTSDERILKRLSSYDMVVLDDFGAERQTEAARQQVFDIVDTLYASNTPMIVTTNISSAYIANPKAEHMRVLDRIRERCEPITVEGPNRRQMAIGD